MPQTLAFIHTVLNFMAVLFIFAFGSILLAGVVMYFVDRFQTRHAVRRNFPLLGRFRYLFEGLGEFFRQYFYAMDREELPFNRAQRSWVYRAAKNILNTQPFGSTRDDRRPGNVIFVNCTFPTLEEDAREPGPITFGPRCATPYTTRSFFNISGMSYGALSRPAVEALSAGAHLAGCWLNSGEGGLSPYHFSGGCDLVMQIGTAKYGVRDADGKLDDHRLLALAQRHEVRMFELKLAQGAKPGKGGILPAVKVTGEIAAIRGIPVGQASISPNRHPEINTVDQLLDTIDHIRDVTGKPTGFKTVIGAWGWLDELAEAIHRRGVDSAPDFITVDGAEGGSGAAPQSLIDYMGLPLREALPLVVDKLAAHGLRRRVRVIASGKLLTPADVAWAFCVGADTVNNARGFMFALGCIQAMQCNRNTCPTGVTTHDPDLQRGLVPADKALRVANYHANLVREVGVIAHACGVAEPRLLRRHHARLVLENGRSKPLDSIHPEPEKGAL